MLQAIKPVEITFSCGHKENTTWTQNRINFETANSNNEDLDDHDGLIVVKKKTKCRQCRKVGR